MIGMPIVLVIFAACFDLQTFDQKLRFERAEGEKEMSEVLEEAVLRSQETDPLSKKRQEKGLL